MEWWHFLLIYVIGCIAGFINVTAGGGSLLTLPVLIQFIGLDSTLANGTNRIAIFIQNIPAILGFKSKGYKPSKYGVLLGVSAFFGAIIGAVLANKIDDSIFNKVLAVVMVLVVIITIFNPSKSELKDIERLGEKHKAIGIFVFFFIGIYGGFIQAGTGLLIMAALTLINRISLVKANSIKVLVAMIYTISALSIFIWNGQVHLLYGLMLAAGNATGGWVSSQWQVKKGDKYVRLFMIVAVLALAIKMMI